MAHWGAAVGAGFAGAAAAGMLFWFVNGIYRVNGVGLLRRQDWPISDPWIWVAVGAVVGTASGFVRSVWRAAHARETRELAEELGREFSPSYSLPEGARPMPVFAGWADGRNAMSGLAGEVPVAVFDYTTVTRGDDSDTVTQGTVALLPADGLVDFDLRPRALGQRLLEWAGFVGLTFDPTAAGPHDAETIRRFAQLFLLSAEDALAALSASGEPRSPESEEREEAIRRLFTPSVMAVLNQYRVYAIQSRPGFLAVWRGAGVLPAPQRTELWDAAVNLRDLLLAPPKGAAEPVVPALAGTDTERQGRRYRNTLLGGVVGVFVGFTLSAMAMPLVIAGQAGGQGPGPGFFAFPVIFIGLLVLGAGVGAGIGSRVPVRALPPGPPEDPARRDARRRATGCGILVGLFGGFFGGFVVFAGTKILFNWRLNAFGLEGALFFGSAFGGAMCGAVLGGVVVNRLYRRWQRRDLTPGRTG